MVVREHREFERHKAGTKNKEWKKIYLIFRLDSVKN